MFRNSWMVQVLPGNLVHDQLFHRRAQTDGNGGLSSKNYVHEGVGVVGDYHRGLGDELLEGRLHVQFHSRHVGVQARHDLLMVFPLVAGLVVALEHNFGMWPVDNREVCAKTYKLQCAPEPTPVVRELLCLAVPRNLPKKHYRARVLRILGRLVFLRVVHLQVPPPAPRLVVGEDVLGDATVREVHTTKVWPNASIPGGREEPIIAAEEPKLDGEHAPARVKLLLPQAPPVLSGGLVAIVGRKNYCYVSLFIVVVICVGVRQHPFAVFLPLLEESVPSLQSGFDVGVIHVPVPVQSHTVDVFHYLRDTVFDGIALLRMPD
mmetsp:Transcript_11116/g.15137  ORF Transcript_11116/g.15137 Transcript_11116/m.15137 type:complete len:320 (-) Transcript_11116:540-1499(-)